MPWFKVDDRLPMSRKLIRIPRARRTAAIGLWTIAGAWSAHDLTDGVVPAYMVEEWGGSLEDAQALVDAGMWEETEHDGDAAYTFVKWGEYQPVKAEVEAKREADRERKRKQPRNDGGKFAGRTVTDTDSARNPDGIQTESERTPTVTGPDSTVPVPARPVPARPDPTPPHNTGEFDEWWSHWRRKKAVGDARKAFPAARKLATLEELIAGADAYFAWVDRNGIEAQYIVGPGPWLRQERWNDELIDRARGQQRPNRDVTSAQSLVDSHQRLFGGVA